MPEDVIGTDGYATTSVGTTSASAGVVGGPSAADWIRVISDTARDWYYTIRQPVPTPAGGGSIVWGDGLPTSATVGVSTQMIVMLGAVLVLVLALKK